MKCSFGIFGKLDEKKNSVEEGRDYLAMSFRMAAVARVFKSKVLFPSKFG
jgi:hypothetical protein